MYMWTHMHTAARSEGLCTRIGGGCDCNLCWFWSGSRENRVDWSVGQTAEDMCHRLIHTSSIPSNILSHWHVFIHMPIQYCTSWTAGIQVRHGVSFHGLGLNCCPDLTWFDHIFPCGFPDKEVTSLSHQLNTTGEYHIVQETYIIIHTVRIVIHSAAVSPDDVIPFLLKNLAQSLHIFYHWSNIVFHTISNNDNNLHHNIHISYYNNKNVI